MPKEYTISSADTWEKKTLTFPADTTGTWGTDNGRGFSIRWCLGAGSNRTATADIYNASEAHATSNQTNLFATNGATFQITALKLESGTIATDFEHRSFAQELTLCQRYYQLLAQRVADQVICFGGFITNEFVGVANLVREMRIVPTLVVSNFTNAFRVYGSGGSNNPSTLITDTALNTPRAFFLRAVFSTDVGRAHLRVLSASNNGGVYATIAVQAEL